MVKWEAFDVDKRFVGGWGWGSTDVFGSCRLIGGVGRYGHVTFDNLRLSAPNKEMADNS